MTLQESTSTYSFGEFRFDARTGELHRQNDDGSSTTSRLSPQPARLLHLLLDRGGELLAREEIRDALWPDTHVDFESSLHFCIRQVRVALGDDADTGRYVETLPRRGYRITVPVETTASVQRPETTMAALPAVQKAGSSGNLQLILWAVSVPLGLIAAGILAIALAQRSAVEKPEQSSRMTPTTSTAASKPSARPLRLAILPFESGLENPRLEPRAARLSEGLTAALTRTFTPTLETDSHTSDRIVRVLGPLSTAPYRELPFPRLDALERELDIDLVLNARVVDGGAKEESPVEGILVELIQTSTGAHLWADFYPATTDWLTVEDTIVSGVTSAISTLSEPGTGQGDS